MRRIVRSVPISAGATFRRIAELSNDPAMQMISMAMPTYKELCKHDNAERASGTKALKECIHSVLGNPGVIRSFGARRIVNREVCVCGAAGFLICQRFLKRNWSQSKLLLGGWVVVQIGSS